MSQKAGVTRLNVGNAIAFAVVLVVNGLAGGTKLLNKRNTADVSALYQNPVTPAGFTFVIWGLIYALLFAFVIYQILPGHRQDPFVRQIGYAFMLSGVFNVAWLFLWQYGFIVASVPVIVALLASLAAIYRRLGAGRSGVSRKEKLFARLGFSVYFGWITVATLADVSAALVAIGWKTSAPSFQNWTEVAILLAFVSAVGLLASRSDLAYVLVVAWGLAGIAANHSIPPGIRGILMDTPATISVVLTASTVGVGIWLAVKRFRSSRALAGTAPKVSA